MIYFIQAVERTTEQRIYADWIVMGVTLVVWFGLFLYLFLLDRKIGKLRKEREK